MVSAGRVWASVARATSRSVLLLVALGACSSADPSGAGLAPGNGAQTAPGSAAGVSGGSSGSGAAKSGAAAQAASSAATAVGAASAAAGTKAASGAAGMSGKNTNPTGTPGDVTSPGASGASGASAAGRAGASQSMTQAGATGMSSMSGAAGAAGGGSSTAASGCVVAPITADMRSRYENMDEAYYTKFASANGVIVATGDKVDDKAVVRYCQLLSEMMSNDKVRKAMLDDKMWFTMIGEEEQLSSLPQINRDYGMSLNQRARGLGGLTPTICAEDSIMCLPGDRWNGDCICPHETGHTLYSSGIERVPELSDRLTAITNAARSSGRLANAYVWMDGNESGMMAWGVQAWYNCAIDGTMGAYHSDINTRDELQKELPEFYQFLSELLPKDNRYEDCYAKP